MCSVVKLNLLYTTELFWEGTEANIRELGNNCSIFVLIRMLLPAERDILSIFRVYHRS